MASQEEIENLQDELMLQQVMLNSIEGDPAVDWEEERRQRREEITELKKQIALLKRQRASAVQQDISGRSTRRAPMNGWMVQLGRLTGVAQQIKAIHEMHMHTHQHQSCHQVRM
jgi:hypothetical protein